MSGLDSCADRDRRACAHTRRTGRPRPRPPIAHDELLTAAATYFKGDGHHPIVPDTAETAAAYPDVLIRAFAPVPPSQARRRRQCRPCGVADSAVAVCPTLGLDHTAMGEPPPGIKAVLERLGTNAQKMLQERAAFVARLHHAGVRIVPGVNNCHEPFGEARTHRAAGPSSLLSCS